MAISWGGLCRRSSARITVPKVPCPSSLTCARSERLIRAAANQGGSSRRGAVAHLDEVLAARQQAGVARVVSWPRPLAWLAGHAVAVLWVRPVLHLVSRRKPVRLGLSLSPVLEPVPGAAGLGLWPARPRAAQGWL